MNIALIFAGGTGQRMQTKARPKQFLELHGKPIIVHTIEQFEGHPDIDAVVVVCLESWIAFLEKVVDRFGLTKVKVVVPGGSTGQASIRNGLEAAAKIASKDSLVLVHDGVRPLVSEETITNCIACTREYGNAITVAPAIETVIQVEGEAVKDVVDRKKCRMAKAPQCFVLDDLLGAHRKAQEEGRDDFIDSASMMRHYGFDLHVVEGNVDNIKITTPADFFLFRAVVDARENSQIFGL